MNDEPIPAPPGETPEARELRELRFQVNSMRGALHILSLCGIVVSASVFLFVHKQVEAFQRQTSEFAAYVADYERTFVPQFEAARSNLHAFAKDNPSVSPILNKYFTNSTAAPKRAVK